MMRLLVYVYLSFHSVHANKLSESGKSILNRTAEERMHSTELDPRKCKGMDVATYLYYALKW